LRDVGCLSGCGKSVGQGCTRGLDALHQFSNLGIDGLIVRCELLLKRRIRLYVRVVDELADGFCGTAHIAPTDMEAALVEHPHPTTALKSRKGEPDGKPFQRLQQSPAERSPDKNGPEPAGESDHDEGKEKSGNKELVQRGTVVRIESGTQPYGDGGKDRSEEETVEAMDMTGENADCEEHEIDTRQDGIDPFVNPGSKRGYGLPRIVVQVRAKPPDDLTGYEQTGHILVEAAVDGPIASLQRFIGYEERVRSM
jgi:hypothetical protein